MGIISNIYLVIFLPLLFSISCQAFGRKAFCFYIAFAGLVLTFLLALKISPNILTYKAVANDFDLFAISAALEFRLDIIGWLFLFLLLFLKLVILIFYRHDIDKFLDDKNSKSFYAVFLLNIFALAGIFTTNNIFNLFFFLEIFSYSFFAIASISHDRDLLKLSFTHFCLNVASSLLILFSFLVLYLVFGEVNFDKIAKNLSLLSTADSWFLTLIFLILTFSFIVKFFPFWIYFKNIKTPNPIANFLVIDSLFIKTNIGIFLMLKFLYFFFEKNLHNFSIIILFFALWLIFYTSVKLYKQRHLKIISIYLCLNNLGFIIAAIALHKVESLQAMFFYLLNFNLVNLFIFIFATFLQRQFSSSSINIIEVVKKNHVLLILPIKILVIFIIGFPLTILFFANWYLAYSSFVVGVEGLLLLALLFSNFMQLVLVTKLITALFAKTNAEVQTPDFIGFKSYQFYLISFWFLISVIFGVILTIQFVDNISLKFAKYLFAGFY